MSTITRELAKLFRKITNSEIDAEGNAHVVLSPADSLLINNARIALASLEAEAVSVNDDMAYAFHHALSDSSLGADEVEELKAGLRAALANVAAPTAPVSVPDEVCWEDVPEDITEDDMEVALAWAHGFNQCRAAMLQGVENAETPTTMQTAPALDSSPKIAELPSGNSPVIPDGWVMVPEDPTHEMLEAGDEQFGTYDVYRRMIAASPQQEVKS
ncbi:TPA: hypothetical protein ACOEEP_000657 [Enterobacter kobei]